MERDEALTKLLEKMIGEYRQEHEKYRQEFQGTPEQLHNLDERHQMYLHDQATRIEAAYKRGKKREAELERIVRNMKEANLDIDMIAKLTGLSKDEIERLDLD